MAIDTIGRFNERVANYIAYRPKYPAAVAEFLRDELGLSTASVVADVGSGTGILSELLLREGCTVFAVEPNEAMRAAAEELLQAYPNFKSVNGQILMHYSALIGQQWDEYIASMRAGVEKHGPVRAGLYSMLKDRRK